MISQQNELLDLYVRGKDFEVVDGERTVKVWLQKMNPVEHTTAIRKADAAKARVLSCKFDTECEEYMSILNEVLSTERDLLIEILVITEKTRITGAREAEVSAEDRWKEDNYLQGLRDLWINEMAERFIEDSEDVEAKRIHDELQAFVNTVEEKIENEAGTFRRSLNTMTDREIIDLSMEHRIKTSADRAWVNEYYRGEVAIGTRRPEDHKQKFFADRAQVDELQFEVYRQLADGFRTLTVDPTEGKDSAVVPPSSDSSPQPDKEATEVSSGQMAVAA